AGEPGIGKTRLALEFARRLSAEGNVILVGSSDEENLLPYQPFVESLSWYSRHCPQTDLRCLLAAIGGGAALPPSLPPLSTPRSRTSKRADDGPGGTAIPSVRSGCRHACVRLAGATDAPRLR